LHRGKVIAICVIAVLAVSLILVAYDSYRNTLVDTSWVETVNTILKEYPSYINDTLIVNPDWTLSILQLHLLENGTNRILYFGSGDTFSNYLINLLRQASIQKGTIAQEQLDKISTSSKAVEITFRFSIEIQSHHYNPAYFILESSPNQELMGTIIAKDSSSTNYNILALSKLPKFP
jgi:hypothetical protein